MIQGTCKFPSFAATISYRQTPSYERDFKNAICQMKGKPVTSVGRQAALKTKKDIRLQMLQFRQHEFDWQLNVTMSQCILPNCCCLFVKNLGNSTKYTAICSTTSTPRSRLCAFANNILFKFTITLGAERRCVPGTLGFLSFGVIATVS